VKDGKKVGTSSVRIFLHWLALFCEGLGALAVWLDAMRLDARMPKNGFTLGDPPGWEAWWWHAGLYGAGLVLGGIVLQGIALALEHRGVADSSARRRDARHERRFI